MWRRDSCLDNSCFYKRFNSVSSIWWCFCVLWETSVSMFGLFHGRRQTKSHEIMWLILVTLGSVFARPGLTWRFHVTWRLIISNTRLFHGSIKRLCDGRLHKEALILQQSARQQQPKKTTIGCWSKHLLLSHGFCFLLCSSRSFCRTQAFSDGCGSGVEQSPSHGTGGSIPAPPVMCRREAEWKGKVELLFTCSGGFTPVRERWVIEEKAPRRWLHLQHLESAEKVCVIRRLSGFTDRCRK